MINFKLTKQKIIDTLSVREYLFFKKMFYKTIGKIDTGVFENKTQFSILNIEYQFLSEFTAKRLKSMSSVDLERMLLKKVCGYLNCVFKNGQTKDGITKKYRIERERMEKNFPSIIYHLQSLRNSDKKVERTFKSFFKSNKYFEKTISLLNANKIIIGDNNELQNNSATKMAILICKLIELNYLKNMNRNKTKLAKAMVQFFSFQFDSSHFSKIIKDYCEFQSFEHDPQHQDFFNSLSFLDEFKA